MKTVDRLMLKSYLGPMLMAFAIVMFVLLMNFLWKWIDTLVGKGLSMSVIMELMLNMMITLIPMGLPLATLFGAIMTMGNLGENYELLAMKSAGMSLPRIMRPLLVVVVVIAIGSFFISNNLVPYAMAKSRALIYDIERQKQNIDFKDGIFFNEIDNMSIRVASQRSEDKLLSDIIIYDNTDQSTARSMSTILADSGYIKLSDDKRHLLVTLYHGAMYDTKRSSYNNDWYDNNTMTNSHFSEHYLANPLSGFDLERSDTDLFSGGQTKNVAQLQRDIDSLQIVVNKQVSTTYGPVFNEHIFRNDRSIMTDSLRAESTRVYPADILDSIARLDLRGQQKLWESAKAMAQNSRAMMNWDERVLKSSLNDLYTHQIGWHEKVVLPFSIMIFFLIGAALGAIIRKGGLGIGRAHV